MQSLGSRLSQMCPARLPPPPQGSQGAQAVCWRLGAGRRLPAGSSLHERGTSPSGSRAGGPPSTAPAHPLPGPPHSAFPATPPGSGRFLLGPTAPVRPVWEVAWAGRWRRDPVEPLPRGRAAEAQTFPYVVALQAGWGGAAPWGCWTRPGDGDHPGLRGGPLPNGISASSYGLDKAERPPALIFVPWNVSHVSPGGSGHCF